MQLPASAFIIKREQSQSHIGGRGECKEVVEMEHFILSISTNSSWEEEVTCSSSPKTSSGYFSFRKETSKIQAKKLHPLYPEKLGGMRRSIEVWCKPMWVKISLNVTF